MILVHNEVVPILQCVYFWRIWNICFWKNKMIWVINLQYQQNLTPFTVLLDSFQQYYFQCHCVLFLRCVVFDSWQCLLTVVPNCREWETPIGFSILERLQKSYWPYLKLFPRFFLTKNCLCSPLLRYWDPKSVSLIVLFDYISTPCI